MNKCVNCGSSRLVEEYKEDDEMMIIQKGLSITCKKCKSHFFYDEADITRCMCVEHESFPEEILDDECCENCGQLECSGECYNESVINDA